MSTALGIVEGGCYGQGEPILKQEFPLPQMGALLVDRRGYEKSIEDLKDLKEALNATRRKR